jgi:uncharacterized protein involved in exopolysaccharide biosynthesis
VGPRKPEETLDLVEYWRAISKRRWSILGLTLVVSVLALLIANNLRPLYRATTTMLIEHGKSKVVSIEEIYSQGVIQREHYQTQVEIVRSDDVARKVIRKLNLTSHPDYDVRQAPPNLWNRLMGTAVADPAQRERGRSAQAGGGALQAGAAGSAGAQQPARQHQLLGL